MAGTSMTTHAALSGSIRGIERASLRARAPVRLTTRLPRRGLVDGSTGSRSRTVVRPGRWTATATDPRADSSSTKPSPAAADDVRAKDDETSARTRSPFPIEDFERASFPTAARFLWASRGLTQGTGLKPLDVSQNWLEQDGYTDDGAEGAEGAEGADDGNNTWIQEMRRRHELIDSERGCVVWDPSASAAAETLLPDDVRLAVRASTDAIRACPRRWRHRPEPRRLEHRPARSAQGNRRDEDLRQAGSGRTLFGA